MAENKKVKRNRFKAAIEARIEDLKIEISAIEASHSAACKSLRDMEGVVKDAGKEPDDS